MCVFSDASVSESDYCLSDSPSEGECEMMIVNDNLVYCDELIPFLGAGSLLMRKLT